MTKTSVNAVKDHIVAMAQGPEPPNVILATLGWDTRRWVIVRVFLVVER